MRSFSKKLAAVLALAMVVTTVPAAQAKAADDFTLNKTSQILYVNEGVNDKGVVEGGLYGNVQTYDFNLKNKPSDWKNYSYKWSSSNEKVATVVSGGVTTAVGVGKATISCTITDKDGKVATTLEATVEVRANAADVEITNANDYDGNTVEVGEVVDLNRAMFDEAGNKTTKRGTYVTDYTRWIAKNPNGKTEDNGVVVDQSTGKYTFTEDAVEGDYLLYCETYQSSKYSQTTATSDSVVVTLVKDKTFEVKQDTASQFTLKFATPVKTLATSDVTMIKRLELATGNYDYPQAIKSVKLADDGLSATVVMFGEFVNNNKYIISVKGYEDLEFAASLGNPVRISISAKDALDGVVLTTNKPAEILVKYYDENGVEVVPENPTVIFRLENRSTDGSYYLAGKNLTIKKEGVAATVIAEYQGRIENGKRVGQLDTKESFVAVNSAPVVVSGLAGQTVNGWTNPTTTMRMGDAGKQLQVKFTKTNNTTTAAVTNNGLFDNYKVTFTALNPEIAVISTTGYLTAFKTGVASFYVNLAEKQSNGTFGTATPVAVVDVTVDAKAVFAYASLNTTAITVGTATGFETGSVVLTAYDNYNAATAVSGADAVTIKCITDGFAEADFAAAFNKTLADGKVTLTFNAKTALDILTAKNAAPAAGEATILYFSATYNNSVSEFSVMIQVPGAADSNYIQVVSSTDSIDALRIKEDNKTGVKTISFEVFEMNNAVKVGKLDFQAYPASASAVSEGTYCFKVMKDGKDVAAKFVQLVGNKVTVTLSDKDANNNVIYDGVGAGTYEFALYQCYGSGENAVLVQEYSNVVNVYVSDAGSYYVAGDLVNNKVASATDDLILACFNIKDRKGNGVLDPNVTKLYDKYEVTKTAVADAGYVYVEKITFYEAVGDEFVPYVVNVDTVLTIGQ